MKKLVAVCAVVGALLASSNAIAGGRQVGEISDAQLASLGLGGMQSLSDAQGEQIRGKFRLRGIPKDIVIPFPSAPKGFVNVFVPGIPFPIFFPERAIGILGRR
jgi:hypothetical protein